MEYFFYLHFPLSRTLIVYFHEVLDGGNVSAERKRKITFVEFGREHYISLNIHNALLGTLHQHKQRSYLFDGLTDESKQNSKGKQDVEAMTMVQNK